jgi:hypothetical protein
MENPTQLEVITNVLTNITQNTDTSGSTGATVTGLNVYQIFPKKIYYPLSAMSNINGGTDTAYVMGSRITPAISTVNFNVMNRNLYFTRSLANQSVTIEYIDNSYNLQIAQLNVPAAAILYMKNVNRMVFSSATSNISSNEVILCSDLSNNSIITASIDSTNCGSSVITIPNGYIGILSNVGILPTFQTGGSGDDIVMYVKDSRNNIKAKRYMSNPGIVQNRYNSLSDFNYPLYPRDTVLFSSISDNSLTKYVHALVTLTPV